MSTPPLRQRASLVAALLLTGLSMRTAVTSVGSVLDQLQAGLHVSGSLAGLITTLPVICFAGFGAVTPRIALRFGAHRLVVIALAVATAGLALRPFVPTGPLFALVTVPALGAAAASNVLMPSLVKQHFPDRFGTMTAVYTTALAVGATAAAGVTVPVGDALGGWRQGLAAWAVLCGLAILPWLPNLADDRHMRRSDPPAAGADRLAPTPTRTGALPAAVLLRSRTAWALVLFFGAQSTQAYIAFGWFARFLTDHGIDHATAGAMVATLSGIGIPASLIAPRVPSRLHRALVSFFLLCLLAAYTGMALAPAGGAWAWMVLAGIGGGAFPLALTLIGLRARTPESTASLSAFVQGFGYVVSGLGPLLFGALFGLTGSWALPMTVLFVALAALAAAARPATAARFVDDEVDAAAASPATAV